MHRFNANLVIYGDSAHALKEEQPPDSDDDDEETKNSSREEKDKKKIEFEKQAWKNVRTNIWRLLSLTFPDKFIISCGFTCLLIASGCQIVIPLFTGQVVEYAALNNNPTQFHWSILYFLITVFICGVFSVLELFSSVSQFFVCVVFYSAFAFPLLMFSFFFLQGLRGYCFSLAIASVRVRARELLLTALFRQEVGFYDSTKTGSLCVSVFAALFLSSSSLLFFFSPLLNLFSFLLFRFHWPGELTSRLNSDCTQVSDSISLNLNVFLRSLVQGIGVMVFMFTINWRLGRLVASLSLSLCSLLPSLFMFP
jgi:ATP-binding cassette subfamily B (MDR/TAP) protein 9